MYERDETRVIQVPRALPPLELVVVQGPAKGMRYPISAGRLSYGRGCDNDLILLDPAVSKHHGLIDYRAPGEVVIYDQESTNGIVVNGERLQKAILRPHEEIQIGTLVCQFVEPNACVPVPA